MKRDITTDMLRLLLTPRVVCTITNRRNKARQQGIHSIQQRHMQKDTHRSRRMTQHTNLRMTQHTSLRMIQLLTLLVLLHLEILITTPPEKHLERAVM
jgi:hypothetical protein